MATTTVTINIRQYACHDYQNDQAIQEEKKLSGIRGNIALDNKILFHTRPAQ
jgi:hypothetical protein